MVEIDGKSKNIIVEFLKEQEFDFSNFDDFIEYIQFRGMLNQNVKAIDKIIFTKANLRKLYAEYINPIKKTSKLLKLNYEELSEKMGYTKNGIQSATSKNIFSEPLKKTLELILENEKLKKENETLKNKFKELENKMKNFFEN
ncbi:hypothetical protein [Campylobacter ureolyticus]|uniref:hypothetical protein n=1 Tax=Campylobacter ureolyticus TaxID=827 RepID=UPI002908E288|nr:hypothetical protein [Campylobacter ureolyticus]MDU5325755.1 hypothetical protein [Campylobacter ureolyticus]